MKYIFLFILAFTMVFLTAFCSFAHASTQPLILSTEQYQKVLESRYELANQLHLGAGSIWDFLGLTLSIAILIEIINSVRKDPNLVEVLGGFFVAAVLGLVIYDLFGFIEGTMNAMAQNISDSTSYWDSIIKSAKALGAAKEGTWDKAKEALKILYFNINNPLVIFLQGFNYFSYLFVVVMAKIVKVVQETVLSYLHVVAPIVIALSVIPRFNLVPTYILTIISMSSWVLFGAIISKVMAVTGGNALMLTSLPDLIKSTISNLTGGFAILAAPTLAVVVFHAGGGLGTILGRVIGSAIGTVQAISSAFLGSAVGFGAGLLGVGGGTVATGMSGALAGAFMGPSGGIKAMASPSQTLRAFVVPKKQSQQSNKNTEKGTEKIGSIKFNRRPKK